MDYKDYAKQYRNWANSATSAETLSDALGEIGRASCRERV